MGASLVSNKGEVPTQIREPRADLQKPYVALLWGSGVPTSTLPCCAQPDRSGFEDPKLLMAPCPCRAGSGVGTNHSLGSSFLAATVPQREHSRALVHLQQSFVATVTVRGSDRSHPALCVINCMSLVVLDQDLQNGLGVGLGYSRPVLQR